MKTLFLGLTLTLCASQTIAQKAPAKFGEISLEDLKMTTYDKDTSAAEVVLLDYGTSTLEYRDGLGRNIAFE